MKNTASKCSVYKTGDVHVLPIKYEYLTCLSNYTVMYVELRHVDSLFWVFSGLVLHTYFNETQTALQFLPGNRGPIHHHDVIKWKHFPRHCHRWFPLTQARDAEHWRFLGGVMIEVKVGIFFFILATIVTYTDSSQSGNKAHLAKCFDVHFLIPVILNTKVCAIELVQVIVIYHKTKGRHILQG